MLTSAGQAEQHEKNRNIKIYDCMQSVVLSNAHSLSRGMNMCVSQIADNKYAEYAYVKENADLAESTGR